MFRSSSFPSPVDLSACAPRQAPSLHSESGRTRSVQAALRSGDKLRAMGNHLPDDHALTWFMEHGGQLHNAVEMRFTPAQGHHFVAIKPIQADEVVCTCPLALSISYLNVIAEPPASIRNYSHQSICSYLVGKVDKSTVTAFFLAEQRLMGKDSFWHPYIRLLPDEAKMKTPLWFDAQELAYLRGTNLCSDDVAYELTSVGKQEATYRDQWNSAVEILRAEEQRISQYTWELFLWARTILTSRSFVSDVVPDVGTEYGTFDILYPLLDVFNHEFAAKVRWLFDDGTFSLSVRGKVPSGQQIYNNYAPKGNEELLMGFGFCIADNPCDQVAFRLNEVSPEVHQKLREDMPHRWRGRTWNSQESVFYIRGASHYDFGYAGSRVPPALPCLRGIPPDLAHSVTVILRASIDKARASSHTTTEQQLWAGTLDTILQRAKVNLQAISRWDNALPQDPPTERAKTASLYRSGQKEILGQLIAELDSFLDPVKGGRISIEDAFSQFSWSY